MTGPTVPPLLLRRLGARLLDLFTVLFVTFALSVTVLIGFMEAITDALDGGPWGRALGATVVFAIVMFVYEVTFLTSTGQTPGKDVMRLRVVDAAGGPLSLGRALVRTSLIVATRFVPGAAAGTACVLLLGLPAPFGRGGRGIHDRVAGTRVEHHDAEETGALRPDTDPDAFEARYGPRSWWGALPLGLGGRAR